LIPPLPPFSLSLINVYSIIGTVMLLIGVFLLLGIGEWYYANAQRDRD
jgi:hypothetical protein